MLTREGLRSQEIIPDKNEFQLELKSTNRQSYYKGLIIPITNSSLLRVRVYGRKYIQNSFVYEINNLLNVRIYAYFCLTDFKITPAMSIKLKM